MRKLRWAFVIVLGCGIAACIHIGCSDDNPASMKPVDGPASLWKIQIEKTDQSLQGHYENIAITIPTSSETMGWFDFLIGYNDAALTFTQAEMGSSLGQCGWEYFTYRYYRDIGPEYPSSLIRLVGMADINNGPVHPDWACLHDIAGDTLVTLTFLISNARNLQCTLQPIRFFWGDCGDNNLGTAGGDSVAISQRVYDADGTQIQDYGLALPGIHGAPDDSCLNINVGNRVLLRSVDFVNGGIDIKCADSIDSRGDLNMNGVPNEVADAVAFARYFTDGLSVFEDHIEGSTQASDVNADGTSLSLEDFVYLIRVIVGDVLPIVPAPGITAKVSMKNGHVAVDCLAAMGAVLLVFNVGGDVGQPVLNVPEMDMMYAIHGGELRILVYNIGHENIPAGTTDVVTIPGTAKLMSAEVAGYEGYNIKVNIVP